MTSTPSLSKALVAAQKAAKAVEKDAKNQHHGYKYASAEAIMEEAREALNSHGLAAVMVNWTVCKRENTSREVVIILFRLMHESGEHMDTTAECFVVPDRGRPEDKALAASLTYAEGYYLRGLLCLPRVDESEDVDQRNDNHRAEQKNSVPSRDTINNEIPSDRRELPEKTEEFKEFLGQVQHLVSEGAYDSVETAFKKIGPKAKELGFTSGKALWKCSDRSVFESLWQEINLVEETV